MPGHTSKSRHSSKKRRTNHQKARRRTTSHMSSDGCNVPGKPRRGCGCQSCRSVFGPPTYQDLVDEGRISGSDRCNLCDDKFEETGAAAESAAKPGVCIYCYTAGKGED